MSGGLNGSRPVDAAGNDMADIARAAAQLSGDTLEPPAAAQQHTCHAVACQRVVPPEMLMCRAHWFLLPLALRKRVLAAYTPGQCTGRKPIRPAWMQAARAAIEYVLQRELPMLVRRLHLPAGYDPERTQVQRVGLSTIAITHPELPMLTGSLATGEIREVKQPAADEGTKAQEPG